MLLAEIHAAGEFADAHEVGVAHQFLAQRREVEQGGKRLHRAYVGEETELLAHGEQALFRAHLGGGVVVVFGVAHGGEEHGVGLLARFECLFRERIAAGVDGRCAYKGFAESDFVTELTANSRHHGYALRGNLGADTVTGQYCDVEFHIVV